MNTREMILETARQLFNEHRSTNISTKQIAAAMGISPGNLYYYFTNKEEIIRHIYKKLSGAMSELFWDQEAKKTEDGITQFYNKLGWLQKHYSFFYLELSVLVRNDPELLEIYRKRSEEVIKRFSSVFDYWVSVGIMKAFKTKEEKEMLVLNSWTLGQLWMTHADMLDTNLPPEVIRISMLRIHHLLRPYFSNKSNKKLDKLMNQ